ncbi:MAG: hypothetical protein ACOY9Y_04550 [Bacillota bacterium]
MTKLAQHATPVFQAEPVYPISYEEYVLRVRGLVEKPIDYSWDLLRGLPHSPVKQIDQLREEKCWILRRAFDHLLNHRAGIWLYLKKKMP